MPLIDDSVVEIDCNGDKYILRKDLGFYNNTVMLVDAIDPTELASFEFIDDANGIVRTKATPGEMVARRNLSKIRAYLVGWSYTDNNGAMLPLIDENILRISPEDARAIMRKITELEGSEPVPFPE